jgi:hypothetical protein
VKPSAAGHGACQPRARDAHQVQRKTRQETVLDVEALRYCIERECNQRAVSCANGIGVLQRMRKQSPANAAALQSRLYEELGQEPEVLVGPGEAQAHEAAVVLPDPQPSGVLGQREALQPWRARLGDGAEAVRLGELVDAADHQRIGFYEISGSRRPDGEGHCRAPASGRPRTFGREYQSGMG